MLSGHRSAWRRRSNKSRAARIAIPLAIPVALGLTLGIILAVSGGNATTIAQSALGSCASAAASARRPRPPAGASAASVPAASAPAASARRRELGRGGALPVGIRLSGGHRRRRPRPLRHPAEQRGEPGRPGRANAVDAAGQHVQLHPERGSRPPPRRTARYPCRPTRSPPRGWPRPGSSGRLHLGQRRHRGRVHRRHDPGAERPAPGVQPAGDQPGHHPGRGADAADDRARAHRSSSASASTATRWPWWAPARGRATASTRSATRSSTRRRSATRPTSTGWPTPRSPAAR